MAEALTESFCERCGTRYTFESQESRRPSGIRRARFLARGVKNFVLPTDGTAGIFADARLAEDQSRLREELDAFQQRFRFCLDCRQYICAACWNESAARCLSCAPMAGQVDPVIAADMLGIESGGREGRFSFDEFDQRAIDGRAAAQLMAWPSADQAVEVADEAVEAVEVADEAVEAVEVADDSHVEQPAHQHRAAASGGEHASTDEGIGVHELVAAPGEVIFLPAAMTPVAEPDVQPEAAAAWFPDVDAGLDEPGMATGLHAVDLDPLQEPPDTWGLGSLDEIADAPLETEQRDAPPVWVPETPAPTPMLMPSFVESDPSGDVPWQGTENDEWSRAGDDEWAAALAREASLGGDPVADDVADRTAPQSVADTGTDVIDAFPLAVPEPGHLWLVEEPAADVEPFDQDWLAARLATLPDFEAGPTAVAEPVAEPELAVAAAPELEAAPESVPAPEPEFVAEAESVAEPEFVAEAESVAEAEPEFVAEAESVAEPEPEFVAEPEFAAEAEPEVVTEPEIVSAPEIVAEPVVAVRPAPILPPVSTPPIQTPLRMPPPPPAITRPWEPTPPPPPARPATPPARPPVQPTPPSGQQWHIVAPDAMPMQTPPAQPTWAGQSAAPAPTRSPLQQLRGIWEASTRDVISQPGSGVRPCGGCALPLSASARFCRRCGQRQD